CIAASFKNRMVGVREQWPGHDDFAALLFGSEKPVRSLTVFDPVHDHREPIDISCAGTAPTMKTAGNQEEPAIIPRLRVMCLHLAIVIDRSVRGQGWIGPAVPENQLRLAIFEGGDIGIGGIEK